VRSFELLFTLVHSVRHFILNRPEEWAFESQAAF